MLSKNKFKLEMIWLYKTTKWRVSYPETQTMWEWGIAHTINYKGMGLVNYETLVYNCLSPSTLAYAIVSNFEEFIMGTMCICI